MIIRRKISFEHDDLTHHILFVGSTGRGKTTFARNLCQKIRKLPEANASVFFIDPKGIDAPKLLEEVELDDSVTYLDPVRGFSFNPLALPPYEPARRDQVVSLHIGYFLNLIHNWYAKSDLSTYAPRMMWLLESTLRYLYRQTDNPTFGDIVDVGHLFLKHDQEKINAFLSKIEQGEDKLIDYELTTELQAIGKIPKDAWFPILTRISRFVTDPFLSKIFNVRRGTVDFLDLLKPGRLTVVRAAGLGSQILPFFISALILGIWFGVRYRHEVLRESNLVLVVGDELHTISNAVDLDELLSQARAFNLGLFFLLQNLSQLPFSVRESLLANTHTHIVAMVSGSDADNFLDTWGLTGEERQRWKKWMTSPPPWTFVGRNRNRMPSIYDLPPPPKRIHTRENVEKWINANVPGFGRPTESLISKIIGEIREFERLLPEGLPDEISWKLLVALERPGSFYNACTRAAVSRGHKTKKAWDSLISQGSIVKVRRVRGATHFGRSRRVQRLYFNPDFSKVAKSLEGRQIAKVAHRYHLKQGNFVTVIPQRIGEFKCDMVAYDYKKHLAMAIEVESSQEIKTHAEQVRINIEKFSDLGFDVLELWFSKRMKEKIRELVGVTPNVELHPV